MSKHTDTAFKIKSWDERPFDKIENGPKLTRAQVEKSYEGDITGSGTLEYLMMHGEDGSASFVGLERVTGSLGKRSGSFVLKHIGTFEQGIAKAELSVVPGSGTGGLTGLRGEGKFESGHQDIYPMQFDYRFEK